MPTIIDLGPVSAYAVAKAHGFSGTEQEWEEYISNASIRASEAVAAKNAAVAAKDLAESYAADALESKNSAIAAENDSEANALDSEAYAVGTRDGSPVTASDLTYQNNSKYYCERAEAVAIDTHEENVYDLDTYESTAIHGKYLNLSSNKIVSGSYTTRTMFVPARYVKEFHITSTADNVHQRFAFCNSTSAGVSIFGGQAYTAPFDVILRSPDVSYKYLGIQFYTDADVSSPTDETYKTYQALMTVVTRSAVDTVARFGVETNAEDISALQNSMTGTSNDILKLRRSLASVEETSTASKDYSVDEYLVMNGTLYKVVSAISEGQIISDTFVEEVSLTSELSDSVAAISNSINDIDDQIDDVNSDISDLERVTDILNGDRSFGVTDFTGTVNINGVTAENVDGVLKLYGTCSTIRNFICFKGYKTVAISSTPFREIISPGRYIVHISVSGANTTAPAITYTRNTFGGTSLVVYDGDVLDADVPMMIGLRIPSSRNYGTVDDPTYISINIEYYEEKAAKDALDKLSASFSDALEMASPNVENGSVASRAYQLGETLVWKNGLYRVTSAISEGASFNVETNIEQISLASHALDVGDLTDLTTTNKTDLVSAINEVSASGGNLADLTTVNKTDLVSAINEVKTSGGNLAALTTTSKTDLVSAINELRTSSANLVANEYSPDATYGFGAYVTYNGDLYRCKEANTTGEWDATKWHHITSGALREVDYSNEAIISGISSMGGGEMLKFRLGSYKTPTSGDTLITYNYNTSTMCAISSCQFGDVFTVSLSCGTGETRGYFIADENMIVLTRGDTNLDLYDNTIRITEPDAAYIVFNNQLSRRRTGYYAYKGRLLDKRVNELEGSYVDSLVPAIFEPVLYTGYIESASGIAKSSTKYRRTTILQGFSDLRGVSLCNNNYEFNAVYYDESGTTSGIGYLGSASYTSDIIYIPEKAVKVAFSFRRTDRDTMTSEDSAAILASLSSMKKTDETLTIERAPADAKVVGERFDSIDESFAVTEKQDVASKNYSIGEVFIWNDTLYKAVVQIDAGQPLVDDTNVVKTSIVELITAVNNRIDATNSKIDVTDAMSDIRFALDGRRKLTITDYDIYGYYIDKDAAFDKSVSGASVFVLERDPLWHGFAIVPRTSYATGVTFFKTEPPGSSYVVDGDSIVDYLCENEIGRHILSGADTEHFIAIPDDCTYILINRKLSATYTPSSIVALSNVMSKAMQSLESQS